MPGPQTSQTRSAGVALEMLPPGRDLWPSLRPAWVTLLEKTGAVSAFLSERWVSTWIHTFGERMSTSGLVWRDQAGQPVGCALLSVPSGRVGLFRISSAFLNASGAWEVGCDHNDVLVLEAHRARVYDDLVSVFRSSGVDEVRLDGVNPDLFRQMSRRWSFPGWDSYTSESPYIDLAAIRASGRRYLQHLSANTRSQIRRSIRLYEERFGPGSVEVAGGPGEALAWFDELVELHERSWRMRGRQGGFGGDARAFHRSLIRSGAGSSGDGLAVDLVRVRFGGETVGLIYNLVCRGRISFYQSGLRYDADGRFKPGFVSHALAVDHYLRHDGLEYDLLGGESEPVQYKRSLTTERRPLHWAQLVDPGPKMALLRSLHMAWDRMRGMGS